MVRKISNLLAGTAMCSVLLAGIAGAKEIQTNMARMQAMDKVTGKVSEIDVPVNGETVFGSFSIVVRYCATRSPEETPENFAFVDVVDNYKTENPVNIFKGWMMSSSPALNAVEHPIYDVWLLNCYDGDTSKMKLLSAEELKARDETIKAQPKTDQLSAEARKALEDEQRAAAEAEKNKKAEEAEALKAAQTEDANSKEISEIPQPVTVEPVVPVAAEEGAPQPLFVPVVPEADETVSTVSSAVVEDGIGELPAIREDMIADTAVAETVKVSLPEVESETEAAETFSDIEASVSDETVPSAAPEAEEGLLLPEAAVIPAEGVEQPAQLIKFEDEIEEDSFDIDAEALAN